MSENAALQLNLFVTSEPAMVKPPVADAEVSPSERKKKERPVRYPDLTAELDLNETMVARRETEAEQRRQYKATNAERKSLGMPPLPKRVKSDAEKAADRECHEKWLDACRVLALRGHQTPQLADLLVEVQRRVQDDPSKYRRESEPSKLATDSVIFLNLGVGQDSLVMVILAALGLLPEWMQKHRLVIMFSDTMCERPSTYAYLLNHLIPFMDRYGLEFMWLKAESNYYGLSEPSEELAWLDSGVAASHTYSEFHVTKNRVLPGLMDIYMSDNHPSFPMWSSRARCNGNSKHGVLGRARDHVRKGWNGRSAGQYTAQGFKDFVLVGIANDETGRAEPTKDQNYQIIYPLIAYNLGRPECLQLIEDAGLPHIEKSGCVTCFAAPTWERWYISQIHPVVFRQMVFMEHLSIEDRTSRNLAPNYVDLEYNLPLAEAVEKYHQDNPTVTVEQCAEWLIKRTYSRDEKPKSCPLSDPNQLTLLGLDEDDMEELMEQMNNGQ